MPVPNTTIRSSHAVSLRAAGTTIGQIQTWAPNQSRTVTPAYELRAETSGEVIENVPGNVTGLTIQVSRYDLFASKMEQVWGTPKALWMLTDQNNKIEVEEKWSNPDGTSEKFIYFDCWFSQLGRNLQAQGDRIVMVNATLNYARVRPV